MNKVNKVLLILALIYHHPLWAQVNIHESIETIQQEEIAINKPKGEPFEGIDMTWQNGSDRREDNIFKKVPLPKYSSCVGEKNTFLKTLIERCMVRFLRVYFFVLWIFLFCLFTFFKEMKDFYGDGFSQ